MSGTPEQRASMRAGKLSHVLLARLLDEHIDLDPSVVVGPGLGRDAAVIRHDGDLLVVKSDPITFATERAAEHVVHVNANDLACMGARPRWMLVTALFPEHNTSVELVERTFRELHAACQSIGVVVIGGHTEVTLGLGHPILVGSMLGDVAADGLVDPARARPGDRLLMTKTAGIEGTAVLGAERRSLLKARLGVAVTMATRGMLDDPGISIVREAELLAADGLASALHDPTEGGIATAVHELAVAAGLGAFISRERIPVADATRALCDALELDPLGLLASGSLLAAIPPERAVLAEARLSEAAIPWSWIGKLTPPEFGFRLRDGDGETELPLFSTDEATRALAATSIDR